MAHQIRELRVVTFVINSKFLINHQKKTALSHNPANLQIFCILKFFNTIIAFRYTNANENFSRLLTKIVQD